MTRPWLSRIALCCLALAAAACRTHEPAGTTTHVVIAIAEPEYRTGETLPAAARTLWTQERGYEVTIVHGDPTKHDIPGLIDAVADADVLVMSLRRQALPEAQLHAVRDHLEAGKPLLAIRTSSHAFALRSNSKPGEQPASLEGRAQWPAFDAEVLGGNYHGHYPNGERSTITAAPGEDKHPILLGVNTPFVSDAGVYKNDPLAASARPLLIARPANDKLPPQPVAWTHRYGQARVFYTSLGNPGDFDQPAFIMLLDQAMKWLCDPSPQAESVR